MDREKQIEEIASVLGKGCKTPCHECVYRNDCIEFNYATSLFYAGYRKKIEVVREIFEEIESLLYKYTYQDVHKDFVVSIGVTYELDELKKKYTEESGNDR